MNVRGFFKNVLTPEGKEATDEATQDAASAGPTHSSGMSSFLSGASRFVDSVQTKKNGLINDLSNKLSSIKLPGDQTTESGATKSGKSRPRKGAGGGDRDGDQDDDSSASEYGDEGDRPMYAEQAPLERQVSVESVDSLPEDEATQWRRDISTMVQSVLNQSSITSEMKTRLETYALRHTGRSGLAKEFRNQLGTMKSVPLNVLTGLAQLMAPILYQCNENDDFAPATHLMQTSFTLYHETKATTMTEQNRLQYLYTLVRDQPIWQSMRFWNAAIFITLQRARGRQTLPPGLEGEEALRVEKEMHDNTTYTELSKFIWRMFALGISKDLCMEFLRKQANTSNLSKGKSRALLANLQKFYGSTEPTQ